MCHYAYISAYESAMGCWGLLDNLGQDTTTSPKYMATSEWMQANAKWWTEADLCGTGIASAVSRTGMTAPGLRVTRGAVIVTGPVAAAGVTLYNLAGMRVARLDGSTAAAGPDNALRWHLAGSVVPGSYVIRAGTASASLNAADW